MNFTQVTERQNGDDVSASWWNDLRDAGIASDGLNGQGAIPETSFVLTNGQASPASITGATLDAADFSSIVFDVEITQKTSINELVFVGVARMFWRPLSLAWDVVLSGDGDEPGIALSVQTTGTVGQLKYILDTLAGSSYVGTFKFRGRTFNV